MLAKQSRTVEEIAEALDVSRVDRFRNGCVATTNRAWQVCAVAPDKDAGRSFLLKNESGFVHASKPRRARKMKCARFAGKTFNASCTKISVSCFTSTGCMPCSIDGAIAA